MRINLEGGSAYNFDVLLDFGADQRTQHFISAPNKFVTTLF